jgi:hypothetical protein
MKKTSNYQIFAHGTNLGHEHDIDCVIELAFKSRERMPVPSGVSMIQSVIYCPAWQHRFDDLAGFNQQSGWENGA